MSTRKREVEREKSGEIKKKNKKKTSNCINGKDYLWVYRWCI